MFKIKKSDLIYVILILVMVIPNTRTIVQKSIHKIIGILNPPELIEASNQSRINSFTGRLMDVKTKREIPLSDFKDKVVFVNFWATWCPPCVAEMPSLQSLYDRYNDEVVFLFISGEDQEEIAPFMEEHNYTFPVYNAMTDLPEVFDHKSIPVTFIIDKQRNVVVEKFGTSDWDTKRTHKILDTLID